MTKKGHPSIPDFSQHRAAKPGEPGAGQQKKPVTRPKPIAKPQATSQKSGRRGQ